MKKPVVIDASFWINIVYLELYSYVSIYFELIFVSKVKSEICVPRKHDYFYLSEDIKIFNDLLANGNSKIENPKKILKKYYSELEKDSGELYTIALAKEKNYGVLIDDGNPYDFCKMQQISRMNTIDFIIFLYIKRNLTKTQSIEYIQKLNLKVKEKYIKQAIAYLINLEW